MIELWTNNYTPLGIPYASPQKNYERAHQRSKRSISLFTYSFAFTQQIQREKPATEAQATDQGQ